MLILVTGASGFLGSWLVHSLLSEGHRVRVLSRKSSGRAHPFSSSVEPHYGDIADLDSVTSAMKGVHSVFHLAGHIGYSRAERALMEAVNVRGTQNVVTACQKSNITRLVHMSSVVAVGASKDGARPLSEEDSFNLHDLDLGYFETKLQAERIVRQAVASGVLDAVILNPSTIYGAGDAAKGSRKTQIKVAQGRFPFYTSGGVSVVGVEEVIAATLTAWRLGRSGERYILSGENLTIQQLFGLISSISGKKAPWIYLPNPLVRALGRLGDGLEGIGRRGPLNSETAATAILYHWFNHEKAKRELGFTPQPAESSVRKSVEWMISQGMIQ